jgi:hypothetical protein
MAKTLQSRDVEIPDFFAHRLVVGIDDVGVHMAVASHVKLHHPIRRNALQEAMRVITMVEGADIDVVDVEQQPASGTAGQFGEKLPFRHLGIVELQVGRDILQHDGAAEKILHQLHPADDMVQCLIGVGNRQQIVQILAVYAGPAQMIGNPFRLDAFGEIAKPLQIFEIGRRGGGDRQRHAVHHHRIALANPVEHAQRLAARQHVVFADHLEPVDRRMTVEDFVVMLGAKPEAKTEVWRLGRIHLAIRKRWHGGLRRFGCDIHAASAASFRAVYISTKTGPGASPGPELRDEIDQAGSNLPLAAMHLSLVIAEKPWPLQALRPLQAWLPPLQALWPLQALAPTQ